MIGKYNRIYEAAMIVMLSQVRINTMNGEQKLLAKK